MFTGHAEERSIAREDGMARPRKAPASPQAADPGSVESLELKEGQVGAVAVVVRNRLPWLGINSSY